MSKTKKNKKDSISKKMDDDFDEMDFPKPAKKPDGKNKNWKNHLLENNEEEFDESSFEEFQNFDDSVNENDDEDDF